MKPRQTATPPPPRCFTDVLDRAIQALGYSTRRSKQARRAVFQVIAATLARGEAVETPVGTFRTVEAAAERERVNPMRGTTERVYRRRRRIVFQPSKKTATKKSPTALETAS